MTELEQIAQGLDQVKSDLDTAMEHLGALNELKLVDEGLDRINKRLDVLLEKERVVSNGSK